MRQGNFIIIDGRPGIVVEFHRTGDTPQILFYSPYEGIRWFSPHLGVNHAAPIDFIIQHAEEYKRLSEEVEKMTDWANQPVKGRIEPDRLTMKLTTIVRGVVPQDYLI